jgi:hypothetical protein
MESIRPRELHTAARVADALVYAAGAAGVIAGGLLFRDGETGFAIVAWALTFVAGAALRLAAWASKALAQLLVRTDQIAEDVADLRRNGLTGPAVGGGPEPGPDVPDPYRRWGGWH